MNDPADQDERGGASAGEHGCPFCSDAFRAAAVARLGTVLAVPDVRPVSPGHLLVLPVRHTPDFFTMTDQEHRDTLELVRRLREKALAEDPTVTGFNVGANCGASAGQRILHAHVHFIPRRDADASNGRGVKGVIRNKMTY